MDYDKGLVAALIREGQPGVKIARERLPSQEYLVGEGKTAYDFVMSFYGNYKKMPTLQLVQQHTGIDLDPDPIGSGNLDAPTLWWVEQLLDRKLHLTLQKCVKDAIQYLESHEPKAAMDAMELALRGIRKDQLAQEAKVETLGPLSQEVWRYYQDVKNGKRGVLSPWPSINEATLGFWPQDLAIFVARVGIGKTWTSILLGLEAWKAGHKVLFATTEISRSRIAMRFLAAHYRLNYANFSKGRLDMFSEKKFEDGIKEILDDEKFYIAGGNFDFRVEPFATAIEEIQPEFLLLDGAYLLRVDGKNRTERAANAFDEIKRLANKYEIPTVATMQFNREVKSNVASSARIESIGLTDVAAWNADLCYALIQTDEMKRGKLLTMKPLKVREGVGEEIDIKWDLDTMSFPEIPRARNADAGDASEGYYSGGDSGNTGGEDAPF